MLSQRTLLLSFDVLFRCFCAPVSILPLNRHSGHSSPSVTDVPAEGSVWPAAVYWTFIEVGTPPRQFPVVIDSGSPFLVISGKGCAGCITKSPNNGYDPSVSSSSRPSSQVLPMANQPGFLEIPPDGRVGSTSSFLYTYKTCDLLHPNAPCSIAGSLYREKVSLGGFGPVDMVVGQIMNQTSNIGQFGVVNGVMGILPPWKGLTQQNFFARLVEEGMCEPVWSLCLNEGATSNGTLTLGGVDRRLADGPITYVKNTASISVGPPLGKMWMYGVNVAQLKVGSSTIQVGYTAFLDSGTNILLLPTNLYQQMKRAMCSDVSLAYCTSLWDNLCTHLTAKQIAAYPTLTIDLDGVSLEMTGKDYLLLGSPVAKHPDQHCIGIRDGGPSALGGFLIGDTTMRNYYIIHDLKNMLIGWGKVNRAACGSLDSSHLDVQADPAAHRGTELASYEFRSSMSPYVFVFCSGALLALSFFVDRRQRVNRHRHSDDDYVRIH
eukprot:TRINITY_DN25979_c0_g1_i1.p1 TRINITY_DN25979_c0_g1~~TRINITY_DN25979_c0_g1_i1.p1  ORF type:complete len:491 (-),score=43.41 TRINITY_DN25979_c0_g1_i1:115-1587(-)